MDNRRTILKQALVLFAHRGYDGVGVQQIALAAGVTKPTLYHYFGSKEGLLTELLQEQAYYFHEALAVATQCQGPLSDTLKGIVETYFHYARTHSNALRLHLALVFAPRESPGYGVAAKIAEIPHHLLVDYFVRAKVGIPQSQESASFLAVSLVGLLNTFATLHLNGYVELTDALVGQVVAHFSNGLSGGKGVEIATPSRRRGGPLKAPKKPAKNL